MSSIEFLAIYFTSPQPLAILSSTLIGIFGSGMAVALSRDTPRLRLSALSMALGLSLFFWIFIAASFALCNLLAEEYEYNLLRALKTVFIWSSAIGLSISFPSTLFLRAYAERRARRLIHGGDNLARTVIQLFNRLAREMGLRDVKILEAKIAAPVSFALRSGESVVLVSKSLLRLLNRDELETVLAHELAHLKFRDAGARLLASIYKFIAPFDPTIWFLDPAIQRSTEFLADDESARVTGKPLALASALVKIHAKFPKQYPGYLASISIMGVRKGLLSRHPPLKSRVDRLLRLHEDMTKSASVNRCI